LANTLFKPTGGTFGALSAKMKTFYYLAVAPESGMDKLVGFELETAESKP